jgi:hypothetical protein
MWEHIWELDVNTLCILMGTRWELVGNLLEIAQVSYKLKPITPLPPHEKKKSEPLGCQEFMFPNHVIELSSTFN